MIWLVVRRLRIPLAVALGLVTLLGVAAALIRSIALARADALGFADCLTDPDADVVCRTAPWNAFVEGWSAAVGITALATIAIPVIAGALVGAWLFGAELSRGTQVFSLTQSISRLRWWITGLLVGALPVVVATALVPPVVAWSRAPHDAVVTLISPLEPGVFLPGGPLPAVYCLLAFCVAATAGQLLRSPIGALGLAVGAVVVLGWWTTYELRQHYLPPEHHRTELPVTDDATTWWGSPAGSLVVDYGYVHADGSEVAQLDLAVDGCDTEQPFFACLRDNGFVELYSHYQPADRYWPFQLIESAIVLALAACALGAGLVGLRRRVH